MDNSDSWSTVPLNTQITGDIIYKSICLVTGEPGQTVTPSWGSPRIYTERNDGGSVNIAFKRSTTVPVASDTPGTSPTYSPTSNGWYDDPALATGTDPLYAIKGNLSGTAWSWGGPYRVDGQSAAEIYFYSDVVNPASPPSFTTVPTYNFTDNSYTAPSGWNKSPPSLVNNGDTVYVVVVLYAGSPAATAATAQNINTIAVSVYAQKTDGDDAESNIVAHLSNPNVIITANSDGTVPSGNFAGSGTDLQLFEGTTPIRFWNSGTTSGTFAVGGGGNGSIVSSSGITRGAGTPVGTSSTYFLRMADVSAMTTDNGTITFNIEGKKLDGTAFAPFSIVQSFSKSKGGDAGESVNLAFIRSSTQPTGSFGTGALPSNFNSIAWTDSPTASGALLWASKGNLNPATGAWAWSTPAYRVDGEAAAEIYFYSDVANPAPASPPGFTALTYDFTSNTAVVPSGWNRSPPSLVNNGDTVYVVVVLYAGSPSDQTAAAQTTSAASIFSQKTDGTSAISYTLSRANFEVACDSSGTPLANAFVGSGTILKVFEGDTPIGYSNNGAGAGTFSVVSNATNNQNGSSLVSNNVTRGNGQQQGSYPNQYLELLPATAMSADTGSIVFTIGGRRHDGTSFPLFEVVQGFTKVRGGGSGPSGLRTIQGYLYYEKSTNLTVLPLAPTFTTYTIASGDINGGSAAMKF